MFLNQNMGNFHQLKHTNKVAEEGEWFLIYKKKQYNEVVECMDKDLSGLVDSSELISFIRKSNSGVSSDDEIEEMEAWIKDAVTAPLDAVGFCRVYCKAPALVKCALNDACLLI